MEENNQNQNDQNSVGDNTGGNVQPNQQAPSVPPPATNQPMQPPPIPKTANSQPNQPPAVPEKKSVPAPQPDQPDTKPGEGLEPEDSPDDANTGISMRQGSQDDLKVVASGGFPKKAVLIALGVVAVLVVLGVIAYFFVFNPPESDGDAMTEDSSSTMTEETPKNTTKEQSKPENNAFENLVKDSDKQLDDLDSETQMEEELNLNEDL